QRPAVLVTLQRVARRGEEVASVEVTVADEFEGVAMESVAAGLGDSVDRRRRVLPVLRWQRVGLELEFLQSVRERNGQVQIVLRIIDGPAVENVIHAERRTS